MRNNKLHTPVGVKDLLLNEYILKDEIVKRLSKVFKSYNYYGIESPMFEYIEVFSDEKLGSTDPNLMYKFFDRNGTTLALRSDMTPPIARIAATAYNDEPTLKLYYIGNTFKSSQDYQGKLSEMLQAGIEYIGINSVAADAEVIALAVNSILSVGIKEFKINIGQVKFFKEILSETGLDKNMQNELQHKIAQRDYAGVEAFIENCNISEISKSFFIELPKLVGKVDVLEYAKKFTKSQEALKALDELKEIYELIKIYGIDEYITFDLGMINYLNYYTGIIFRGYTYGSGYSIVGGGRYDNLVKQFGKDTPAVGMGIAINEIMSVIERENINILDKELKSLIAYKKSGEKKAIEVAKLYRSKGMIVETNCCNIEFDKIFEYAKKKNISHMLYFLNDEDIKLVNLQDDYIVDIKVDELTIYTTLDKEDKQ